MMTQGKAEQCLTAPAQQQRIRVQGRTLQGVRLQQDATHGLKDPLWNISVDIPVTEAHQPGNVPVLQKGGGRSEKCRQSHTCVLEQHAVLQGVVACMHVHAPHTGV